MLRYDPEQHGFFAFLRDQLVDPSHQGVAPYDDGSDLWIEQQTPESKLHVFQVQLLEPRDELPVEPVRQLLVIVLEVVRAQKRLRVVDEHQVPLLVHENIRVAAVSVGDEIVEQLAAHELLIPLLSLRRVGARVSKELDAGHP